MNTFVYSTNDSDYCAENSLLINFTFDYDDIVVTLDFSLSFSEIS